MRSVLEIFQKSVACLTAWVRLAKSTIPATTCALKSMVMHVILRRTPSVNGNPRPNKSRESRIAAGSGAMNANRTADPTAHVLPAIAGCWPTCKEQFRNGAVATCRCPRLAGLARNVGGW